MKDMCFAAQVSVLNVNR